MGLLHEKKPGRRNNHKKYRPTTSRLRIMTAEQEKLNQAISFDPKFIIYI